MNVQTGGDMEVVYGEWSDQLLFIPKGRALELAHLLNALFTSKT
jgi:hypothetical protein